jgi:hypothetical protein
MVDERCKDCERFVELFGGRTGGGMKCPDDDTEGRKTVHANDYACGNIKGSVKSNERD